MTADLPADRPARDLAVPTVGPRPAPSRPRRLALVGTGWRSEFFLRLARALPSHLEVSSVVTRSAGRAEEVERDWRVAAVRDLDATGDADLVVVSTPWGVTPEVAREVVSRGRPVLLETPPAPDADGLRALWADVGSSGLVQVAEQYSLMPGHAARLALVRSGAIGEVTSAQVCSTHQYHAMSLIRDLVGVGAEPAVVTAVATTSPLADPITRAGWRGDDTPRPATTTIGLLDLGDGRSGLYDFTDNQWHNPLRTRRVVVRGSRGEVADDRVVRLVDEATVLESALHRRQLGYDLDLEGLGVDVISHDGTVLYRNPFPGVALSDDDLAVATLLDAAAAWSTGDGPGPYPLAAACQDHLLALAVGQAAREGRPVTTAREAWADALA